MQIMARDHYAGYTELARHEKQGTDYRIVVHDVASSVTIIAPHGGKIEPGTAQLASAVAGDQYNYYGFEGLKTAHNRTLHITSHKFDEPRALAILKRSRIVVAVHACTGTEGVIYLGGRDEALKRTLAEQLQFHGIRTSRTHSRFQGAKPDNICNRGATQKGVQLEITRDLRDDPARMDRVAAALRAALAHGRQQVF